MGTARAVFLVALLAAQAEAEPSRDVPCSHRALAASGQKLPSIVEARLPERSDASGFNTHILPSQTHRATHCV
ncbi:MAG: hypothetical protein ACK55Z_04510, partial [bacterium]